MPEQVILRQRRVSSGAPMKARYRGRCWSCGGPIRKGDEITYREHNHARHVDCSPWLPPEEY